jgi:hypothetical protein
MPNVTFTRETIPDALLAARETALAEFFSAESAPVAMAFAARPHPQHNVVGIGIGRKVVKGRATAQHCVRFYVEKKLDEDAIPKQFLLPGRIGAETTDVIETGLFRAFAIAERKFLRPARPGCSVGFAFTGKDAAAVMAGTFGALVEADGKRYILSNNHVLANQNALPLGSTIYQPGLLDKNSPVPDQIAKLSRFVPLQAQKANRVDCAIAELLEAASAKPNVMPRVNKLRSGDPVAAVEGAKVEKSGRTTSYTTGTIRDVAATVKVRYDLGMLTFTDQILIVGGTKSFSNEGDSGSLIVEQKSKRPVGLLFGGTETHTIANHIEDVLKELKVTIVA